MTPRISIRPMTARDLDFIFRIQLDEESNRMAGTNPRSREAFYPHWQSVLADPKIHAFTILCGEIEVGFISCFSRDEHYEVGYWIDREHWGRGIATKALRLFLGEVSIRPMRAIASTSNRASLKVLEHCGFALDRVEWSPASERYPECEIAILTLNSSAGIDFDIA